LFGVLVMNTNALLFYAGRDFCVLVTCGLICIVELSLRAFYNDAPVPPFFFTVTTLFFTNVNSSMSLDCEFDCRVLLHELLMRVVSTSQCRSTLQKFTPILGPKPFCSLFRLNLRLSRSQAVLTPVLYSWRVYHHVSPCCISLPFNNRTVRAVQLGVPLPSRFAGFVSRPLS